MAKGIKTERSEKVRRSAVVDVLRERLVILKHQVDILENQGKFHDAVEYKMRMEEVQLMLNTMLLKDF